MTGQVVVAIILALGVATCGWFIRREAQREKARRDLAAAQADLRRRVEAAQVAIGLQLIPAFGALAVAAGQAAHAFADFDAAWSDVTEATR